MDYYDIIAGNFQATLESVAMSVDDLAPPIARGSQLIADALLADQRVFACGNGADAALAQLFVSHLLGQLEHERPSLPAMTLAGDGAALTGIAQGNGIDEIFSRPLRALGQDGDVLLVIASDGIAGSLRRAVETAQERQMGVVVLSNSRSDGGWPIAAGDVEIRVAATASTITTQLQVMILHNLCALIEHTLFGDFSQD